MRGETSDATKTREVTVWDLPTRLFHWALVALVILSLYTGFVGGLREMELHMLSGQAILALVAFRLIWGFIGGTHARFADFVKGPGAVLDYLRGRSPETLGHNPAGALSVLGLLGLLALQAATGLFANDDIFTEGPLMKYVSKDTSDFLTFVHHTSVNLLVVLIVLHLGAIAFYLRVKKTNLVRPMVTGRRAVATGSGHRDATGGSPLLALVILVACGLAVWFGVRL